MSAPAPAVKAPSARDAGKAAQKAMSVNQPGDAFEREAHLMAEEILYLPAGYAYAPGLSAYSAGADARQAPPSVNDVVATAGRPLDAAVRAFMEPRFRHDFSRVRVHNDAKAAASARELHANAYTVNDHIVFGEGRYDTGSREGLQLMAHELAHTVQQRKLAAPAAVQRDQIDDAREKLSYGWLDWAITDGDAMEALALLGEIDPANLQKELARLEPKYVTRLLDNLPDAAKTGDVYKRVIAAIGPSGIMPYVTDQLSTSFFGLDWAVTDSEVTRAFNTYANLPEASRELFFTNLHSRGKLGALIDNCNKGHHKLYVQPFLSTLQKGKTTAAQNDILHDIVANSDNLKTTTMATEIRFDIAVGKSKEPDYTPSDWELDKLRQTYLLLERLPDAHVGKNKELTYLGQFTQGSEYTSRAGGFYHAGSLNINTVDSDQFDQNVMHETGHAVDEQLKWTDGKTEPAKPERGGWIQYDGKVADWVEAMFNDSNGYVKNNLKPEQVRTIAALGQIVVAKGKPREFLEEVQGLEWYKRLSKDKQQKIDTDKAFEALPGALLEPWNQPDGGLRLGNRIYQRGYSYSFTSYLHAARARLLTAYQFRDVREWFAECYAFYYLPDKRGKGAKLNEKDPSTKQYFDSVVDKMPASR